MTWLCWAICPTASPSCMRARSSRRVRQRRWPLAATSLHENPARSESAPGRPAPRRRHLRDSAGRRRSRQVRVWRALPACAGRLRSPAIARTCRRGPFRALQPSYRAQEHRSCSGELGEEPGCRQKSAVGRRSAGAHLQARNHQIGRKVSFRLREGERLGIVGESGSGKSSVLKMIVGLVEPTEGYMRFGNTRLDGLAVTGRNGFAVTFN